jgi:hypothetical protein
MPGMPVDEDQDANQEWEDHEDRTPTDKDDEGEEVAE